MNKKYIVPVFMSIFTVLAFCIMFDQRAEAETGPVVIGILEQVENHSKAFNKDYLQTGSFGSVTYVKSGLFMTRQLDRKLTGMLTYVNRYDVDSRETANHVGGISLFPQFTKQWRGTLSLVHVSNPQRATSESIIARSSSNWLILGADYSSEPEGRSKKSWDAGISFNSTADLTNDRMVVIKIGQRMKTGKKTDAGIVSETIYGFKGGSESTAKQELLAGRYSAVANYRRSPMSKLSFEVIYQDNRYTGNPGDDVICRLSMIQLFNSK